MDQEKSLRCALAKLRGNRRYRTFTDEKGLWISLDRWTLEVYWTKDGLNVAIHTSTGDTLLCQRIRVSVVDTRVGAYLDEHGRCTLRDVPPGEHMLQFAYHRRRDLLVTEMPPRTKAMV